MRRWAVLLLWSCAHGAAQSAPPPASCGDPNLTAVTVTYLGHALEGATFTEGTHLTRWRVVNPLRAPVTVSQWRYRLEVAGRPITSDVPDAVLTVPPRSCQELELRQKLDFIALFGEELPANGPFEISAAPSVDGQPLPAIEKRGSFPLPRPPTLTFGRMHVTKGGESFAIDVELVVHNPNEFPVTIDRYEAELLIAGNRFSRLRGGELVIAARGLETLALKTSAPVMNLNGLARAALSSTEAISTDLNAKLFIGGRPYVRSAGGMIYPR